MAVTVTRITDVEFELIDELTSIEAEAFGDGGLNRWTFPVVIRHGAVYVLKCDDKVRGVADIIKDWVDPELAFIINLVIKKEDRGRGLGYKFLSELLRELRDDGVKRVQLTVDPKNEVAKHLYRKAGFRQIAELDGEYGPIEDRLLYELELEG